MSGDIGIALHSAAVQISSAAVLQKGYYQHFWHTIERPEYTIVLRHIAMTLGSK
jgi:hypothetical protein